MAPDPVSGYLVPLAALLGVFALSAVVIGKGDGLRCLGVLFGVPGMLVAMGWALARTALPTLAVVVVTALLGFAAGAAAPGSKPRADPAPGFLAPAILAGPTQPGSRDK